MRAIGIILAGGNNSKMRELSKKRAIGAMPIAGSYRAIDFSLSNMSNSHIQKVAVLTQYNAWSLNEHLSSSKWWDFGRKQGGLFVFTPSITSDNGFWYRGTADAIAQNMAFLKKSHEPYAIIASADAVYKLDYNKVLERHVETGADITIVCKDIGSTEKALAYGVVTTDSNGRIVDFEEKPGETTSSKISTGIYVIRRRLLIQLIEQCMAEDNYDFVNDIIIRNKDTKRITVGKQIKTHLADIFLSQFRQDVRDIICKHTDVYSKVADLPPAKYNPGSKVRNSLISSGCIINGEVDGSVVFHQAYIGNNCVIKNSIILNDVYIGDNTVIENCIVESHSTINPNEKLGSEDSEVQIINERNFRYSL